MKSEQMRYADEIQKQRRDRTASNEWSVYSLLLPVLKTA